MCNEVGWTAVQEWLNFCIILFIPVIFSCFSGPVNLFAIEHFLELSLSLFVNSLWLFSVLANFLADSSRMLLCGFHDSIW